MISICVPNLNGVAYLPERIATIRAQTHRDYEVVIVDNFSDDGAYEVFQAYAASDPRVRLSQAPREGMYANWNNCLRAARGEWIYVATSDDTMSPDCLERLLAATRHAPGAGAITSLPWIIDAAGKDQSTEADLATRRLMGRRRKRSGWTVPRRELLWAAVIGTPTLSITQLLIRRETFGKTGLFPTQYGSTGDFAWQLRLVNGAPVYHVGEQLGSWRRHATQATQDNFGALYRQRARMLVDWLRESPPRLDAGLAAAFGYSLALAEAEAPEDLPAPVRRWNSRFRHLLQRHRSLVRTSLVALAARAMTWPASGAPIPPEGPVSAVAR